MNADNSDVLIATVFSAAHEAPLGEGQQQQQGWAREHVKLVEMPTVFAARTGTPDVDAAALEEAALKEAVQSWLRRADACKRSVVNFDAVTAQVREHLQLMLRFNATAHETSATLRLSNARVRIIVQSVP